MYLVHNVKKIVTGGVDYVANSNHYKHISFLLEIQ